MFEKIISDGKNLVIDNAKLASPIDPELLLERNDIISVDMRNTAKESDEKFATYILRDYVSQPIEMGDIENEIRRVVMDTGKNPVLVIYNAEAGIGYDMFYDLISIIQGMFQRNVISEKNYGFQSVFIIGNGITEDLLSEHEYGNVYRKPWVSGELYHNYFLGQKNNYLKTAQ